MLMKKRYVGWVAAVLAGVAIVAVSGYKIWQTGWQEEGPIHSPSNTPIPTEVRSSQDSKEEKVAQKDAVRIVLDSEPRLVSPIQTTVRPGDQTFSITFADKMDRSSVEEAVKSNMEKACSKEIWKSFDYFFEWKDDSVLKLSVKVKADPKETPEAPPVYYHVNVDGARTQAGRTLADAPFFIAHLMEPVQLWRVSADGRVREKLSDFKEPVFAASVLPNSEPWAVLHRFTSYCECDARTPYLSYIYDMDQKTLQKYPSEIMASYQGEGNFYADSRGFFVAAPQDDSQLPKTEGAIHMRPGGYIWGSAWSKNGRTIIMAKGDAFEDVTDLDLLLFDTQTGEYRSFPGVIRGELGDREVSSAKVPIDFFDDGTYVHFSVLAKERGEAARYRYHWKTQTVSDWEPPIQDAYYWVNFKDSSDGIYRLYSGLSLFKNEMPLGGPGEYVQAYHSVWLPGTHTLVSLTVGENRYNLVQFHADSLKESLLADDLPQDTHLAGTSGDGKWIYLYSRGDLSPDA